MVDAPRERSIEVFSIERASLASTPVMNDRLVLCAIFLCPVVAACADPDPGLLSAQDAADLALSELTLQEDSIVSQWPTMLEAGAEIGPYQGPTSLLSRSPVRLEGPAWFLWVDDEPGAAFVHDTRFVLVDAETGDVSITDEHWWPVLDGTGLWTDADAYWSGDDWVGHGPELTPRRSGFVPATAALDGGVPVSGAAVVINRWLKGEYGYQQFLDTAANIADGLEAAGLSTRRLQPYAGVEVEDSEIAAYFAEQAKALKPGDDFVVFLEGHGGVGQDGVTSIGGVSEYALAAWLSQIDPEVNITVIIDGCHSGGMIDGLSCVADVTIVSTSEDSVAYFDLDERVSWVGEDNPDQGLEFSSGIALGLFELLGVPDELSRVQARAADNGESFIEALLAESYLLAVENDAGFNAGRTFPMLSRGGTDDPATCEPPEPMPDPEPTPDPEPDPTPGLEPVGCIDDPQNDFVLYSSPKTPGAGNPAFDVALVEVRAVADRLRAEVKMHGSLASGAGEATAGVLFRRAGIGAPEPGFWTDVVLEAGVKTDAQGVLQPYLQRYDGQWSDLDPNGLVDVGIDGDTMFVELDGYLIVGSTDKNVTFDFDVVALTVEDAMPYVVDSTDPVSCSFDAATPAVTCTPGC